VSGEEKDDIPVITKMASGQTYTFLISRAEIKDHIYFMEKLGIENIASDEHIAIQVHSEQIKQAAVLRGQKGDIYSANGPIDFIGTLNPMLVEAMYVEV
jgi:hypothetical protein